ncbi:hypothetical protein [Nitrosomonas sp.]|uniref:hypothetical protein n=1 Tax=Nitrosomonas sp. TaxID=42353 RepID=UPI001E06CF67|nr:hypothetical protein [Nitrosomonas sp.]MBX3617231.1 hypothetical protein [Nitrosomonas sp.]
MNITSVTFHFDDSNGAGGVYAPSNVNAGDTNFAIADPVGSAPFAFVTDGLSFSGNDLVVSITRAGLGCFLAKWHLMPHRYSGA